MGSPDAVCVLVPTYNEAATIGSVVRGFRDKGFDHVLVIDGGSTDGTRSIAREHGARVVEQSGSGKGQAVREALEYIDRPYVLMVDGDATYRPDEADRMVEPLLSGEAEHVIGNRFANIDPEAMSGLNRFGNAVINRAFRTIHRRDFTDILSGYRAFTKRSVDSFSLTESGFGIETEMAVECAKHNVPTTVVPITYEPRPNESDTNLRPFRDGADIIVTLYQMAKTNNPLFYFGSVGLLSILTGVGLGSFVGYRWFVAGISHEVLALVAGVLLLLGVQLVMFGALSDLMVTVNREQTRQFERITEQLAERSGGGSEAASEVPEESPPSEDRPDASR